MQRDCGDDIASSRSWRTTSSASYSSQQVNTALIDALRRENWDLKQIIQGLFQRQAEERECFSVGNLRYEKRLKKEISELRQKVGFLSGRLSRLLTEQEHGRIQRAALRQQYLKLLSLNQRANHSLKALNEGIREKQHEITVLTGRLRQSKATPEGLSNNETTTYPLKKFLGWYNKRRPALIKPKGVFPNINCRNRE
jgi:hypothetical protein